jgi:ABC-type nitrate/sulfonate/bicarbonate transport system permease component
MSAKLSKVSRDRRETVIYTIISIVGVILFWHVFSVHYLQNEFILPSPMQVVGGIERISRGYLGGNLLYHAASSLLIVMVGYLIGLSIGIPLGIAMAWYETVNKVVGPIVAVLRPIPTPAWIPLAILWFGIGMSGKVFVIILSSMVPCIFNSYAAVKETPEELLAAAKTMGASKRTLLFEVAIPSGLPTIVAGMRIALGNAWATVVAAELVAASAGLGFLILAGYRNFEAPVMAAGIISIAVVGVLMNFAFQWFERRITPWRESEDR